MPGFCGCRGYLCLWGEDELSSCWCCVRHRPHSQPEIPGAMLVAACSWLSEGGTSVVTFYRLPKQLCSQKCLS